MTKVLRASVAVAASLLATGSFAYSARISVEKLIATAEIIVLARFTDVRSAGVNPRIERIATAEILATWKGRPSGTRIDYVASPGWFACDISGARVGESVLLFLTKSGDGYHIAHFGRGSMPLIKVDGASHARTYEANVPSRLNVGQLRSFPDSVPLHLLYALVKQHGE